MTTTKNDLLPYCVQPETRTLIGAGEFLGIPITLGKRITFTKLATRKCSPLPSTHTKTGTRLDSGSMIGMMGTLIGWGTQQ